MTGSRVSGLLLLLLFTGCSAPPREPRAVRPESDVCPECRMTVVPGGHAAEAVDSEGLVTVFDDPGCLVLYVHDHPDRFKGAVYFVQDAESQAWVSFETAVFVRADDVKTPMNYGWHAFSTKTRADSFAAGHPGAKLAGGEPLQALVTDLEARRWQP